MTNEEKMVWAARFSQEIAEGELPARAAIRAGVAVLALREASKFVEKHGSLNSYSENDAEYVSMLQEMAKS